MDTNLLGTGQVQKAAIFGLDGSPWANSSGFSVSNSNLKFKLIFFVQCTLIQLAHN